MISYNYLVLFILGVEVVGNVGLALCNEKLKPGQLADVLNGGSCP
jgi:hypothetical protein